MLANLKNRLLGVLLVGMMWAGSQSGCDVNSAYLGGLADYYTGGGYVGGYDPVGYAPGCLCDSYDYYYPGAYYYEY
jgi:hypothetical protein